MTTVSKQIQSADEAICRNIESLADQRALLAQNILSQLRNLVEGVAVRLHAGSPSEFNYPAVDPALAFVKSKGRFSFLGRFHKLIQKSASHYTMDGDASERLMLKYYEYLYRMFSIPSLAHHVSAQVALAVCEEHQRKCRDGLGDDPCQKHLELFKLSERIDFNGIKMSRA